MGRAALLLVCVLVPLGGAFILPLLGRVSALLRNVCALCLVGVSLACSILLVPGALAGQDVTWSAAGPLGMSFTLTADALAVFMALVSSLVGAVIMLFSFDYISHYKNQNEYYLMAVLFLGAMMGLVFSANLVFLFVFWEITGIASWRLIGFYRGKSDVLRADKAFLITAFGALLMLLAIVAVYGQTGSFDLAAVKGTTLPWIVSGLFLVGMLSKSATLPFHTWLPDAGVAPSPVTALLHAAVLVKIGVYVFARLFLVTFQLDDGMRTAVIAAAAASALVSAGAALIETDIKRIVAYSTVSQIAFIFLGLAMGNAVGHRGGAPVHPHARPCQGGSLPLRGDHRAERGHQGHHEARRPAEDHAGHRRLVPVLRLLGHGIPAPRRVLQQVHGRHLGGGRGPARDGRGIPRRGGPHDPLPLPPVLQGVPRRVPRRRPRGGALGADGGVRGAAGGALTRRRHPRGLAVSSRTRGPGRHAGGGAVNDMMLILPIVIPAAAGVIALLVPGKVRWIASLVAVAASAAQVAVAIVLFPADSAFSVSWLGYGIDFSLRLTRMSAFIVLAIAGFSFLVSLYAASSMAKAPSTRPFFAWMLLTVGMASGAALADNLVLLLVFWEGLLLTLFGMISTGANRPFETAIKAVIIVGVTDLCMMLGVMLTGRLAGTLTMSAIRLPVDGIGGVAFILLMVGALGKAGAMPFHSWIPDAALDAPLPFMAILPASIEKLLGIYFLARLSLDLFTLVPGSWVSVVLMIVGAVTIILAVMMALVQKDYKRLLSYHAISQVGYMVLGIGTALPIGIVGGLFHMVNHAMYKSCLFLTGGAVEKQAGLDGPREAGRPGAVHARHGDLLHRGRRVDLGGAPVQRVLLQGDGLRRGPGKRLGLLRRGSPGLLLHRGIVPQARPRRLLRQALRAERRGP